MCDIHDIFVKYVNTLKPEIIFGIFTHDKPRIAIASLRCIKVVSLFRSAIIDVLGFKLHLCCEAPPGDCVNVVNF